MSKNKLTMGISPCPNDTYIFHAMIHGLVDVPFEIDLRMADVQELNKMAERGALDISKISVGAWPVVAKNYAALDSGAALGFGCGPLLVARENLPVEAFSQAVLAHPGSMTTACRLIDLHGGFTGQRKEMIFDRIMPAVASGEADCGIIIHEGRFTYGEYGLHKIMDTGEWWETAYKVPLPLGMIVARRELGAEMIAAVSSAIRASLEHANAHPEAGRDFIKTHAQEMADPVIAAHIKTFVNQYSLSLGEDGRKAIEILTGTSCL